MMHPETVNGVRTQRALQFNLDAPATAVFPLLCPVREYDWIENWQCKLIHSLSGVAEYGCIFQTARPGAPVDTWTVSRYEPPGCIEFVICNALYVTHMRLVLSEGRDSGSQLDWEFVMTALVDLHSAQLDEIADLRHSALCKLEMALSHYLSTGRMLTHDTTSS